MCQVFTFVFENQSFLFLIQTDRRKTSKLKSYSNDFVIENSSKLRTIVNQCHALFKQKYKIFFYFELIVSNLYALPVVYYRCQSGCDGHHPQGLYRAFYDLIMSIEDLKEKIIVIQSILIIIQTNKESARRHRNWCISGPSSC